jgi:hypothetical protein
MAPKRPSERNTKSEILSAFDELLQQNQTLEQQLSQRSTLKPVEPIAQESIMVVEAPKTLAPASQQPTMESIVEGLSQLQLNFGSAVRDLSEKLTLEAFKLQEIQHHVQQEQQQLADLHNLETTDDCLDELITNYEDSAKTFSEEYRQQQETLEQALTQARKTWAKEQEEHRRFLEERRTGLVKTRFRGSEEYTYDLDLERKLASEAEEQERKQLYLALEELQQAQEKQWAEREQAIAKQEQEFADLKIKVESIPKELESAIKRAKEEGKGIATHQAKIKADLAAKEMEGNQRTYALRIQSLQDTIANQEVRIQTLSKQLDAALKQVQDLAVKAIEGASNANSFQAMKDIAIEQAKTQNKTK